MKHVYAIARSGTLLLLIASFGGNSQGQWNALSPPPAVWIAGAPRTEGNGFFPGPRITAAPTYANGGVCHTEVSPANGNIAQSGTAGPEGSCPYSVASGVATVRSTGCAPGVYMADTVSHVVLNNEDLTNASFIDVGVPTVTSNTVTDPAGATAADRIADDSGADAEGRRQNVTIANDSTSWTATVWIRCTSAHVVTLRLLLSGGTAVTAVTRPTCSTTTWSRYEVTAANNASGNVTAAVDLYPTDNSDVGATGNADFWRPTLYNESLAVNSDPAVGSTACSATAAGATIGSWTPGDRATVCSWVWMTAGASPQFGWDNGSIVLYFLIGTGSAEIQFVTQGLTGNAAVTSSTTMSARTWTHVCWAWDQAAADVRIYINAAEVSYTDTDRTWTAGGNFGTTFSFGPGTGLTSERYLSDFMFWSGYALSTTQVGRVYNRTLTGHSG